MQLIDAFTHNFDYIGTRTTGNGGGNYLLAGPGWKGEVPAGIAKALPLRDGARLGVLPHPALRPLRPREREEGAGRLPGPDALAVPGQAAPARRARHRLRRAPLARRSSAPRPTSSTCSPSSLGFCPSHPSEVALRERFAKLGIEGGKPFDPSRLSPEILQAVKDGMADAWKEFADFKARDIDTGKKGSADVFGTREYLEEQLPLPHGGRRPRHLRQLEGGGALPHLLRGLGGRAARRLEEGLRAALPDGRPAAGRRLLVAHALRAAVEAPVRQSAEALPRQLADAVRPRARRRRRPHAPRAACLAGRREGVELAARAVRPLLHGPAPLPAEEGGARRHVEAARAAGNPDHREASEWNPSR